MECSICKKAVNETAKKQMQIYKTGEYRYICDECFENIKILLQKPSAEKTDSAVNYLIELMNNTEDLEVKENIQKYISDNISAENQDQRASIAVRKAVYCVISLIIILAGIIVVSKFMG